jgi:bifunctional NMN adenylyltransferase/nudix hydrolase
MHKLFVVIGRFQILHKGHVSLIQEALDSCQEGDHVLVLVGSSNKERSLKNPLSFEARNEIICNEFRGLTNLHTARLRDYDYNEKLWTRNLHAIISQIAEPLFNNEYFIPVFTSSLKDNDASVRKTWSRGADFLISPPVTDSALALSSTEIRKFISNELALSSTEIRKFIANESPVYQKLISSSMSAYLNSHPEVAEFLIKQTKFVEDYKKSWEVAPYPTTMIATDAVVRDSKGDFLMIKRGGEMGNGSVALAGGFLEVGLTYEQNMTKELLEETGLDLNEVPHTIVTSWHCDSPLRAERGRMVTQVFLIQLEYEFHTSDEGLVELCHRNLLVKKLQAGDDAAGILIMSLEEVWSSVLFNDHAGLIERVLHLEQLGVPYIKNS